MFSVSIRAWETALAIPYEHNTTSTGCWYRVGKKKQRKNRSYKSRWLVMDLIEWESEASSRKRLITAALLRWVAHFHTRVVCLPFLPITPSTITILLSGWTDRHFRKGGTHSDLLPHELCIILPNNFTKVSDRPFSTLVHTYPLTPSQNISRRSQTYTNWNLIALSRQYVLLRDVWYVKQSFSRRHTVLLVDRPP